MKNGVTFDKTGFQIDGKDAYLVSGEFHYFRVPMEDWERRMILFREAGGNCLATYVPWIIHEPEEGKILFDDIPQRNLTAFLSLAAKVGLKVILRPGPYQYSELVNGGLPVWLIDHYPEILAQDISGKSFCSTSVSYLHPVFLEKARKYYRAFAEVVRPFMAENGGPVCMLQVDNEMTGIHVWFGSLDYHAETMGFGKEDGRYATWLRAKYGSVEKMNAAYGGNNISFAATIPTEQDSQRARRDYKDFYLSTIAEYAYLLRSWLREDGLGGPICHNSANPGMNSQFLETVEKMGEGFLLGSDHYYALNQTWKQNNPTPQYAISVMMSCDLLRALGMPPCIMELPGGSPSDTPPMLREDVLACYLTNIALGAKGVNFYVYTGGPNFPGTGTTAAIYDYNALVRADGTKNETFAALEEMGKLVSSHSGMQRGKRVASVQIGFEWSMFRDAEFDAVGRSLGNADISYFIEHGIVYTLMCSGYSPELVPLTGMPDLTRPLIVPCAGSMSESAQKIVAEFLKNGGNVLFLPVLPEQDENGNECRILRNMLTLPGEAAEKNAAGDRVISVNGTGNVYGIRILQEYRAEANESAVLARDGKTGNAVAFLTNAGNGKAIVFGGSWMMTTFPQAAMMEEFLRMLGAKRAVTSSNRNIFTALWEDPDGNRLLYIMNLYSGKQSAEIFLGDEKQYVGKFDLAPMEVRVLDL